MPRLFIGNVSDKVAQRELNEAFEKFGKVINVQTGMAGFAFVEMSTEEESEIALREAPGIELDGKRITVEIARGDRREERRGGGGGMNGSFGGDRTPLPPSRDDFRCYNCGGRGHLARDCGEKPRNPMYADTRGTKLGEDRGRFHPYGGSSRPSRDDRRDMERRDDDRDLREYDRGRDWDRMDGRRMDRYEDRERVPFGSGEMRGDPYYSNPPNRSSYGPPPGYPPMPNRRYSPPPPSFGPDSRGVRGDPGRGSRPYDDYYDRRVGPSGGEFMGRRERSPERGMGYPPREMMGGPPRASYTNGPPMDDFGRRGRSPERPPYYGRSSSPDRYGPGSSRSGGQLASLEAQRSGGRARTPDRF